MDKHFVFFYTDFDTSLQLCFLKIFERKNFILQLIWSLNCFFMAGFVWESADFLFESQADVLQDLSAVTDICTVLMLFLWQCYAAAVLPCFLGNCMNPQQNKVPAPEFILVHVFRNSFLYRKVTVNCIFFSHAELSHSPPQSPAVPTNFWGDTSREFSAVWIRWSSWHLFLRDALCSYQTWRCRVFTVYAKLKPGFSACLLGWMAVGWEQPSTACSWSFSLSGMWCCLEGALCRDHLPAGQAGKPLALVCVTPALLRGHCRPSPAQQPGLASRRASRMLRETKSPHGLQAE